MSQLNLPESNNITAFCSKMPFTKLFLGFKHAIQPSRLFLALAGVIIIFIVGGVMDLCTPKSARVVVSNAPGHLAAGQNNELLAFTKAKFEDPILGLQAYCDLAQRQSQAMLLDIATNALDEDPARIKNHLADGNAQDWLHQEYQRALAQVVVDLRQRYYTRQTNIEDEYADRLHLEGKKLERNQKLADAKKAYLQLFAWLVDDQTNSETITKTGALLNKLVVVDSRLTEQDRLDDLKSVEAIRKQTLKTLMLAQAHRIAKDLNGKGIFATLVGFNAQRFHHAVMALVGQLSPRAAAKEIYASIASIWWLAKYHYIYGIIFGLIFLAIWSVIGGAICRMAALQIARDERIGPLRALQFSVSRFASFFTAPLAPIGVIVLIVLVTFLGSLLGAIPVVGEIFTGLMIFLSLIGGFFIALLLVGLIGGLNLMFPTVAVEGSDSFDAFSRSYSYIFAKPWRMGFYTLVSAIYGGICYLFVRLFVFLILASSHFAVGLAVNLDGAAYLDRDLCGKLNALWEPPTFNDLVPSINWMALSGAEAFGAALVWVWVSLVALTVLAFVTSFVCTASTTIYFLLRQRVDGTDLEDIYVDHDVDELLNDEQEPQPTDETTPSDTTEPTEPPTDQQPPTDTTPPTETTPPNDHPPPTTHPTTSSQPHTPQQQKTGPDIQKSDPVYLRHPTKKLFPLPLLNQCRPQNPWCHNLLLYIIWLNSHKVGWFDFVGGLRESKRWIYRIVGSSR